MVQNTNWGEVGLFYNPHNKLKKGVYLLTFKVKDGDHDTASNLDRDDIYRLNLGISKDSFIKLFGEIPARPKAGGVVAMDMDYNFSKTDTVLPHPVYGWMAWICVLNPSKATFTTLTPLIEEVYQLAIKKYLMKLRKE